MKSIPLFEAKNRLSELLDAVALGEVFVITRRGQVCAQLQAVRVGEGEPSGAVTAAFAQLAQLRGKLDLQDDLKAIAREGLA